MLITVDALAQAQVSQPDTLFVADCRHDLLDHAAGKKAYDLGHIPGAVFIDMEHGLATTRTGKNGRHPLPSLEETRTYFARIGLGPNMHLVAYDSNGGMYAVRLWWMARWAGLKNVSLLDGGLSAWQNTGRAVQTEAALRSALSHTQAFGSATECMPRVSANDVVANLKSKAKRVVDARATPRYRGENETIDPVAGHIPGALNRFFQTNLQANGAFKPAAVLREEFIALLGETQPTEVIHQCGSGVTACHNIFAMELAGLHGSALFPGSWSEWVSDPTRPVATGEAPG